MIRFLTVSLVSIGLLASLSSCSSSRTSNAADAKTDLAAVDSIFDEVMTRYRLPGMALGVIIDGRVVHTRTAGELIAGSNQPVDNDTLFKIASNSKAMTTALLARLVEAGKLRWDDPVTRYLPDFKMYDPWVTQQIQVRDLLIHNTGLREGAGDLMLWPTPNGFTRADIISGLAHLKPQQSFRSQYAYDNLMYVVAGEVAAAAGGASYEQLMRREIFEPLGMTRCQLGEWDRNAVGNVAQPHMRREDSNVIVRADGKLIATDTFAAAGGIRCSLNDMLTWMRVWLSDDMRATDGTNWLSQAQRDALWSARRDSAPSAPGVATLTMSKVDPEADFSYDFEDLAFTRTGECPARSQAETGEMQSQVDQMMSRYDGAVPGASLLIVRDGKPLVRRSYGLANLEDHTAAAPDTNYRLASVSKQFTAAAILLLAEDGKLSLDDSLRKWFPRLPDVATSMTLRHVLTHMSGLIDYEDVIPPAMTKQLHDADVLRILETQNRTYFAPGTAYRYSNSGYALLALIVGKASGRDFAAFLKQRVFTPLGMTNTVAYEEGVSTVNRRAFGYSEERGRWTRSDQSQTSAVLGDGGIYSSIDDLAKWDAALYDDRLLSARSRQLAFTPVTDTDDPTVRYAMGWRITQEQIGGSTLWHSGETIGFRNVIIRYPERNFTVVLLTNRNDPEPYQTARALAQLFLK